MFRKYEFNTKDKAQQMIDALGVDDEGNPTHKHSIVHLGNITLQQGEYDADGNEINSPIISDKYHIDILWTDLSSDWADYEVWCPPVGAHIFGNSEAVREWTARCKEIHPEYFPEEEKIN